jgi:HSP20 family protein
MVRNLMSRTPRQSFPLSRVFDHFFQEDPFLALAPVTLNQAAPSAMMALDLGEDEAGFTIQASLPGFRENEVQIEVYDGVLTIKAEKSQEEQNDSGTTWHRRERRFGSVTRQIQLPEPVIEDQARAELSNGVPTLTLPKVQKAPARKIAINGINPTSNGTNDRAGR